MILLLRSLVGAPSSSSSSSNNTLHRRAMLGNFFIGASSRFLRRTGSNVAFENELFSQKLQLKKHFSGSRIPNNKFQMCALRTIAGRSIQSSAHVRFIDSSPPDRKTFVYRKSMLGNLFIGASSGFLRRTGSNAAFVNELFSQELQLKKHFSGSRIPNNKLQICALRTIAGRSIQRSAHVRFIDSSPPERRTFVYRKSSTVCSHPTRLCVMRPSHLEQLTFYQHINALKLGNRRILSKELWCHGWRNGVGALRHARFAIRASSGGSLGKKSNNSKTKAHFVCENCGESFSQWWGSCRNCKEMNTLKEFRDPVQSGGPRGGAAARAMERINLTTKSGDGVEKSAGKGAWLKADSLRPQRLADVVKGYSKKHWRLALPGDTGSEVSRVLGGGIVPGSLILVGGDPGVGKSTLLLQIAGLLALGCNDDPAPVLYISGEESVEQISDRADRMQIGAHELFLYSATDLELVLEAIQELKPRAVVVDSIQTVYLPEATGSAGSVIQVRECAAAMLRLAKQTSIPIFLVGHVTKTGDIAGPRVLEHIVDVVLYMEGERLQSHRLLRVVKNRYGSSDEVGVFEMVEGGLEAITNPSALFLSERAEDSNFTTAAAVAVTMEGSRPILLEVQALCSLGGNQQAGRRTANGVDNQRLYLLLAVLMKQAGLKLQNQDVFINVVGGLQLREPASDVAVAIAICSSYLEKPVPRDMAFIGEIGLGGEIRSVGQLERRITEAAKLGFKSCIVPRSAKGVVKNITAIPCADIREVLKRVLGWPE